MITLKDIATEAGVSVMTVSNVINGNNSKVSQQTIEKVNAIIEKYNYVPNMSARSLAAKQSKIIALFLPVWGSYANYTLDDPYKSKVVSIIESLLCELGYYVMLRSVETVRDVTSLLNNWNIDGSIFILPHTDKVNMEVIRRSKSPIVILDRYYQNSDSLSINIDDYKGGYIAAKHFIHSGHSKIAFAGPIDKDSSVLKARYNGFVDAVKECNLDINENHIFITDTNYQVGIDLARHICNMEDKPSAIFATADILAAGIMEGVRLNGFLVPNDLSVIGFDNLPLSQYVTPKLTTISQDVEEKATLAVELLVDAIEDSSLRNKQITLDVQLVDRQSVKTLSNSTMKG